MKIRNGFVSNSSSSSFIIPVSSIPATVGELQRLLFGDEEVYQLYGDEESTARIAQTIFEDFNCVDVLSFEDLVDEMTDAFYEQTEKKAKEPSYPRKKTKEALDKYYDLLEIYEEQREIAAIELAVGHIKKFAVQDFKKIRYSDNDSSFSSVIEHGEFWSKLPGVMRVSHH